MPSPATFAVLAAAVFATVGIFAFAAYVGGWFGDEARETVKYVAAIGPFAALVSAGIGGSRMGVRDAKSRTVV